ncbi:MAG: hypothetical protein EP335_13980 [Alphaproteobacteria bacterium]|nr:MAG: hypothetical protein EP335_13980 [Alphaproteobacteria bacterium]
MTGKTNPKVDGVIAKSNQWAAEYRALRAIVLGCGLTEDLKWGVPCYTDGKANVLLIHGFKDYCALLFFKGALMKDPEGILIQQTENVQAGRQIRFDGITEIEGREAVLKAYVEEAIAVEKAGLKVEYRETRDFPVPEELAARFEAEPAFKVAFEALTPGRQRGYLLHFAGAKQSKTRAARIEKLAPKIYEGKGLQD